LARVTATPYAGARDLYKIGASSVRGSPGQVLGAASVQRNQVEALAAHRPRAYNVANNIEPQIYALQVAPRARSL
jgi:hypothetical protein